MNRVQSKYQININDFIIVSARNSKFTQAPWISAKLSKATLVKMCLMKLCQIRSVIGNLTIMVFLGSEGNYVNSVLFD